MRNEKEVALFLAALLTIVTMWIGVIIGIALSNILFGSASCPAALLGMVSGGIGFAAPMVVLDRLDFFG